MMEEEYDKEKWREEPFNQSWN